MCASLAGLTLIVFVQNDFNLKFCIVIFPFLSNPTGLAATAVPVYIAEAAPSHARGRLVIVTGCCIAGGTATSGVIGGSFSYFTWGWR